MRILTRASELARLQGHLVAQRLNEAWPEAEVVLLSRDSAGDRDRQTPLAQMADKGAFTSDLSDALARGDADIVVHSWKDQPIEPRRDTIVAATLPRGDARDVLLMRHDAVDRRPSRLRILSSSPRRALMLGESLPAMLPWPVDSVECVPVRGNVPTRVRRLIEMAGDGLIVAKAALDRLLDPASPFPETAASIRAGLSACRWMVLPLREHPSAAAQGALAIEVAASNAPLIAKLAEINDRTTWQAVQRERELLAAHGGGCHQAIGATVLTMPFGDVVSVRGMTPTGERLSQWTLEQPRPAQPKASVASVWPRPDERAGVTRVARDAPQPSGDAGFYVTREEALPAAWQVGPERFVWAAGASTWRKLAARGVWVHGSSEGLGHFNPAVANHLAGRPLQWHRLTHAGAGVPNALPTYDADSALPADLDARTHFFWRSGSEFRKAIAAFPVIRDRWHACGPGDTLDVVEPVVGAARVRPSLGYTEWLQEITG